MYLTPGMPLTCLYIMLVVCLHCLILYLITFFPEDLVEVQFIHTFIFHSLYMIIIVFFFWLYFPPLSHPFCLPYFPSRTPRPVYSICKYICLPLCVPDNFSFFILLIYCCLHFYNEHKINI